MSLLSSPACSHNRHGLCPNSSKPDSSPYSITDYLFTCVPPDHAMSGDYLCRVYACTAPMVPIDFAGMWLSGTIRARCWAATLTPWLTRCSLAAWWAPLATRCSHTSSCSHHACQHARLLPVSFSFLHDLHELLLRLYISFCELDSLLLQTPELQPCKYSRSSTLSRRDLLGHSACRVLQRTVQIPRTCCCVGFFAGALGCLDHWP